MFIIVFNQSNIVQDGQNNKLLYNFPNSIMLTDKYIAICSISMFYSWFNITQLSSNNQFTFTWTAGTVTTTYTVLIPDGFYEITTINDYIQFFCIQNGLYWTISGLNYYPIELILNPSRYAVQLNTYYIPISAPVGSTVPANFPGWPTTAQNSVVTIPANFNIIIGFAIGFTSNANIGNPIIPYSANSIVNKNAAGTYSYISTFAPQVQPNNNVLFSMSNINSPYSQPNNIIYSLNPNVNVGEQVFEVPPNYAWVKLIDGTYNNLRLSLLNNLLQPLIINDPNMTFLLVIKDKDERY
jgi:hypothetical protein